MVDSSTDFFLGQSLQGKSFSFRFRFVFVSFRHRLSVTLSQGVRSTSALFPSQGRTIVVPEDLGSVRGDFGWFCSILGDFSVGDRTPLSHVLDTRSVGFLNSRPDTNCVPVRVFSHHKPILFLDCQVSRKVVQESSERPRFAQLAAFCMASYERRVGRLPPLG